MEKPLIANSAATHLTEDRQWVKITFENDDGEKNESLIKRSQLPTLIASLQTKIEYAQAQANEAKPDQVYQVCGYRTQILPDGHRHLILDALLPETNQFLSLPLRLTPKDIQAVIDLLTYEPNPQPAQ